MTHTPPGRIIVGNSKATELICRAFVKLFFLPRQRSSANPTALLRNPTSLPKKIQMAPAILTLGVAMGRSCPTIVFNEQPGT